MKIYGIPEELPAPEMDFKNFDFTAHHDAEQAHEKALKAHLIAVGYTGKNTGGILQMPHADGYALYMLADGPESCLIHLPYGDGWHSPNAEFLPKREVVKRIKQSDNIAKLFEARN